MKEIYPWQTAQWQNLVQRRAAGRMPHALLFTGPKGLGKRHFAEQLAHSLLCQQPMEGAACGQCQRCHLLEAGTHPDFEVITPEEGSKVIKIEQIRKLTESFTLKSQLGGYKVVIIEPAETMNQASANALLKTLEEPGHNSLLILLSSMPGLLPATIRSRCQKISFSVPSRENAIAWLSEQGVQQPELALSLAGGAPIKAIFYMDDEVIKQRQELFNGLQGVIAGKVDPVLLAGKWHSEGLSESLSWMTSWVMDMIRVKSTLNQCRLTNQDLHQALHMLAQQTGFDMLYKQLDKLKKATQLAETQVNSQLLMEDLLIPWAGYRNNRARN